jgi:lipopolysaccharide transport system ATP-binding protein
MSGSAEHALIGEDVWKRFRRVNVRGHTTLKSLLLGRDPKRRRRPEYHQALREITFSVPRGGSWGIIGPNGSGKTTLLKLITGIYRPDRGLIRVRGKLASLIELGAGFHPDFSGRENVILNGLILGMSKKEIAGRFGEIVAFSELEEFIDEPVRTYSTGMYMRLAFSIAVHVDPDVLLLDEVLSVGDEAFGRKCVDKIASFRERGKTILFVSHNLGAIERFCDRALLFRAGRIAGEGPPAEVIAIYRASLEDAEGPGASASGGPS